MRGAVVLSGYASPMYDDLYRVASMARDGIFKRPAYLSGLHGQKRKRKNSLSSRAPS